ncbi:MAG: hypothetical protein RLZZ440_1523 [Planctomycetota bacterium]
MRRVALVVVVACLPLGLGLPAARAPAQVVLPPTVGLPARASLVPGPGYDLALETLAKGDYSTALELAERNASGSIRIGADRWIDSIPAAAVVGECLFELGRYREAAARYEEALNLQAAYSQWLLSVQFPQQPLQPVRRPRAAGWGRSQRNTAPAAIPERMTIRQKAPDVQETLQKGGVLASDYDRPIRPQEIVRGLTIAAYRFGSIMGELGRDNPALDAVARGLAKRPAPANHYSQAWVDVPLGIALWAQGKPDQAQPLLTRGLVIGNQFDHPLTAWALIVLGRIALDADRNDDAVKYFEEATYAAADDGDLRAIEEAFALAWQAYHLAGLRGVPPSIRLAAEASRGGPAVLRARLLAMQAETAATAGDRPTAEAALKAIDGRLLRGEAGRGPLGWIAAAATAIVGYSAGDLAAGDQAVEQALALAQSRSLPLFRLGQLVDLVRAGSNRVSDRQADGWFAGWLADPSPRDVAADPIGSLAILTAPRDVAFDTWVAVAARRGNEEALAAAEATMRARWIAARPLGGRRAAVLRFLAADRRSLDAVEAARRDAIVAGTPGLDAILTRSAQLRSDLAATVAAAPEAGLAGAPAAWRDYAETSLRLQQVVASLAIGRQATPPAFPPLSSTAEIRRRLAKGQALLSFHWTASGLFAAFETSDRLIAWQVRQAAGIPGELAVLAAEFGLGERLATVTSERLLGSEWQGSAARLERMLFENSRGVSLADGIDELVIVPDGWLWYLPFEILPIASTQAGEAARPLRELVRLRYAPTRTLAVLRYESRGPGLAGGIVGRMGRGEKPAAGFDAMEAMLAGVDRRVVFEPAASAPPPALVGSLCDSLVIADELAATDPAAVPLLTTGAGRPGITPADWLAAPVKQPQRVVLPGLQSAVAGGLAKPPSRPGSELFLTATDLVAAGAHTALLSRWRMGGLTASQLVQEFLREASRGEPAPAAWQRAVDLMLPEPPDLDREPRIEHRGGGLLADSRHPLFWSGYLLIDCGGGAYAAAAEPPARAAPAGGPAPPPGPRPPADGAPASGPMPPAILAPPPPRAEP